MSLLGRSSLKARSSKMKSIIKMNNLWKKARGVFVKPRVVHCFRSWRNSPGLPVWTHGPIIRLGKYSKDYRESTGCKHIYNLAYEWTESYKAAHPFIAKHFKPTYRLPIWLSFNVFNFDVMWKTKYDSYRYEFPGQFTIVLFGFAFTWWNACPIVPEGDWRPDNDDGYWESILWYNEAKASGMSDIEALKFASMHVGAIKKFEKEDEENEWMLHPEYIKDLKLRQEFAEWQSQQSFEILDEGGLLEKKGDSLSSA